ncbi:MAG TPA: DUF1573 domain-containing protein [Bacteroidales bacterium]|nr:DUF1573 domain-containing protein [Bacteroidales bacterium]
MKKFIYSFALLMFTAFALNAQDAATAQPAQPENPNAPEIQFDKTVHDYGTIVQGGDGTCEFKFTNVGKEPLILSRPQSSCGCTVPTWPQEPVLPGKSDVIKVTYNTNNVGTINKTVTVTSNAKTNRVVLQIKGTVTPKPATTMPEKPAEPGAAPIQK